MLPNTKRVIDQFFQDFYFDNIMPEANRVNGGLSSAMFWFSVIDFYSGIYYVGETGDMNYAGSKKNPYLNLAHFKAQELFIKKYFPFPESEYTDFIYRVFRNGMIHQISPKKGGVEWEPANPKMIWVNNPTGDIIAHLNLYKFQDLTYKSFLAFYKDVVDSKWDSQCDTVCAKLIDTYDALEDEKVLKEKYKALVDRGFPI